MLSKFLFALICLSVVVSLACSTTGTSNANAGNAANQTDSANLPSGFSTSPVPMSANSTPGIPNASDANKVPMENIPGIPDPNKKTPVPKNTPPIPGIPDQETLKKQMNTPIRDVNVVNNPPKNQSDANNKPAEKPRGNIRQPQ